jgi:hypothetical protein
MTVIVACGGTLWGGQNTHVALQNRAPVEISCADYLRQRPDAAWLRLTHCYPDFEHLAVESSTHTPSNGPSTTLTTAVYVPLRAAQGSTEARTQILLSSDDADMLGLGAQFGGTVGDAVVTELSTAVEGLVESGLSLSQRRKADLAKLNLRLADDFVIVDRGDRPRALWFALGELALGLGALYLLVRRYRRWSRAGQSPLPRATLARDRASGDDTAEPS